LESEELQWFRGATLRNHNRVAARVADALGLPVRCFIYTEESSKGVLFEMHASEGIWLFTGPPDHGSCNTYGTIFNFHKDMTCFPTSTFRYHEKFPPRGTVVSTQHGVEHTKDTIYERTDHTQVETLFPDENFMRQCEALGFNRNNAIKIYCFGIYV
jgi:hypothetical protein